MQQNVQKYKVSSQAQQKRAASIPKFALEKEEATKSSPRERKGIKASESHSPLLLGANASHPLEVLIQIRSFISAQRMSIARNTQTLKARRSSPFRMSSGSIAGQVHADFLAAVRVVHTNAFCLMH